jgi:hypothetical protein
MTNTRGMSDVNGETGESVEGCLHFKAKKKPINYEDVANENIIELLNSLCK